MLTRHLLFIVRGTLSCQFSLDISSSQENSSFYSCTWMTKALLPSLEFKKKKNTNSSVGQHNTQIH